MIHLLNQLLVCLKRKTKLKIKRKDAGYYTKEKLSIVTGIIFCISAFEVLLVQEKGK